jgi:hypothetical protein
MFRGINNYYGMTRTLYVSAVGVAEAPEILQTRTVTVVVEDTHAFQVNPDPGSAAGLAAAVIVVESPVTLAVPVVQAPAARALPPMLEVVPLKGS